VRRLFGPGDFRPATAHLRVGFGQLSAFLGIALREGQTSARVANTAEIVLERHAAAVSDVLNSSARVRQS
jgi:hypothetical protein